MSRVKSGKLCRSVSALVVLAMLAAACGSSGEDPALDSTAATSGPDEAASSPAASQDVADPDSTTSSAEGTPTSAEPSVTTTSAAATTTSEAVRPDQPPLPDLCNRDLVVPILPTQLTFTVDSGLFSVGFDGEFECLLVVEDGIEIETWGAQADKVLFVDGSIVTVANDGKVADDVDRESVAFSRPTGFNYVWIADQAIQKSRIDGQQVRTLELGVPASEVTYHPDGAHLLSVTADPASGGSSIYISDNEGLNGVPLVFSDDAVITDLTISAGGSKVVFVATHEDGLGHVHLLDLAASTQTVPDENGEDELILAPSPEHGVVTLHESIVPLDGLVLNSDGTRAAIAEGTCATGSTIEWLDLEAGGYATAVLPELSVRPVGFTTASTLAVMAYGADCDAGGDLYLVDLDSGTSSLVRADVDSAAIRRIDATVRYSLVDVIIAGFA